MDDGVSGAMDAKLVVHVEVEVGMLMVVTVAVARCRRRPVDGLNHP